VIWLDFPSILARSWNHFSRLLNVHGVIDVRQTYSRANSVLSPVQVFEVAIDKLKRHKSPGTDQIPAEFIKAGGRTIRYEFIKLINSIWNNDELPAESIIIHIYPWSVPSTSSSNL
jgi:hypothetical protein